jgi:hypothetical protein
VFRRTAFCMSRSGHFACYRLFWEDTVSPDGQTGAPQRPWLGYRESIANLTDFFLFMSRFAQEFGPGVELEYETRAEPLRGRVMTDQGDILTTDSEPCRVESFHRERRASVEDLRSGWTDICTDTAAGLVELFFGGLIPRESIRYNVEAFLAHRLY